MMVVTPEKIWTSRVNLRVQNGPKTASGSDFKDTPNHVAPSYFTPLWPILHQHQSAARALEEKGHGLQVVHRQTHTRTQGYKSLCTREHVHVHDFDNSL